MTKTARQRLCFGPFLCHNYCLWLSLNSLSTSLCKHVNLPRFVPRSDSTDACDMNLQRNSPEAEPEDSRVLHSRRREASQFLEIDSHWRNYSSIPSPSLSDTDLLNLPIAAPPLLGSPYTCDIWGPSAGYPRRSPSFVDTGSQCSSDLSRQLGGYSGSVESLWSSEEQLNSGDLQSMLHQMLTVMRHLQCRIDALLLDARRMRVQVWALSHNLQKLVADIDKTLRRATGTRLDLADKIYLEHLISMLNGDLRHLPLENWPFRFGPTHPDEEQERNLVI